MQKPTYEELEKQVKKLEEIAAKSKTLNEIHFLESLEIVNKAISKDTEVNQVIDDVIGSVFSIFECDRIWLFHPCDPNAPTIQVLAEKNKQEYSGAFVSGQKLPVTPEAAETIRKALEADSPIVFDPESGNELDDVALQFSVRSQIIMAIHPMKGKPWMFGMHQCTHARVWTKTEQLLFKMISFRVVEGLNNLMLLRDLKKSEQKYRRFFETVRNGWAYHKIVVDDKNNPVDYIFLEINPAFELQTGLKRENVIGKKVTEVLPEIEKDPADWIGRYGKVALTGESISFENYSESIKKWYTVTASSPEKGYFIAVFEDIDERKKNEKEKEELIVELQKALGEIKTLRGILPLCSFCKKNRDDKGYWEKVDVYIHKHSQADISHSVCPECMQKHYPEHSE